jgi:hypothetical protein
VRDVTWLITFKSVQLLPIFRNTQHMLISSRPQTQTCLLSTKNDARRVVRFDIGIVIVYRFMMLKSVLALYSTQCNTRRRIVSQKKQIILSETAVKLYYIVEGERSCFTWKRVFFLCWYRPTVVCIGKLIVFAPWFL